MSIGVTFRSMKFQYGPTMCKVINVRDISIQKDEDAYAEKESIIFLLNIFKSILIDYDKQ